MIFKDMTLHSLVEEITIR